MATPQQADPTLPPKTRRKKAPKPRPAHCLNCDTAAAGKFCAECGQEIKDHSVSLGPLLSEGLTELVSWDSKLLRTLAPLLVRPGFLTNEYNAGHRVPYLSPLKLYLTVSVLFFLLMAWKNPAAHDLQFEPGGVAVSVGGTGHLRPAPRTAAEYEAQQKALPPASRDIPFKQAMARQAYKAKQSPQAFASALIGDIPKMMFFLLPVFALSLKLLYLRTKRLYVEHLIFLLHVHAFGFLALSPLLFLHPDWLIVIVALVLPVYVVRAMRVVYKQGWLKTLVKFGLLSFLYSLLLALCFAGTAFAALWLL
jgi:hypothetical protein